MGLAWLSGLGLGEAAPALGKANWDKIYKNSNLYGFQKFKNPDSTTINCGIAINIESINCLADLLSLLSGEERYFSSSGSTAVNMGTLELFQDEFELQVRTSKERSAFERRERLKSAPSKPETIQVISTVFKRNPDVVAEVLERAKGICQLCKKPTPFKRRSDDSPYLEVHHKILLAFGGEDTIENAIAVCPNCHRKHHFG